MCAELIIIRIRPEPSLQLFQERAPKLVTEVTFDVTYEHFIKRY